MPPTGKPRLISEWLSGTSTKDVVDISSALAPVIPKAGKTLPRKRQGQRESREVLWFGLRWLFVCHGRWRGLDCVREKHGDLQMEFELLSG